MSWKIKEKLRATLSGESGVILKEWGGKRSVALVYPNAYGVGMANLAVHSIYGILNAREDIVCERAFLPEPADLREHIRTGTPVLSLETQRPLSDFDVIAFTISFENDYLDIIPILHASKIDHRASGRRDSDPLIVAGGAAPTLNPLPLTGIADAVILGEIEGYENDLFAVISQVESKASAVAELGKLGGVITADKIARAREEPRRHAGNLDSFKTQTVIHYPKGQFHDMHLVEVERGCPHRCRFCATPAIYGRPRMRSAEQVLAMARDGLKKRKRIGLIGADLLSHPDFVRIAEGIHGMGATFSPSSVRADAIDDSKAALLATSGHRSIALGVEAGSQKLRATLAKGISDEKILNAAATLAKNGITNIRLYFMIGLPGENDDDIQAIPEFARKVYDEIAANAPKRRRSTAVDITVTPFVPKPGTPFEGRPFASEDEIKRKLKALKRLVGKDKGLSLRHDSYSDAASEHLLANGDESAIDFLEKSFELGSTRKALKP
jgi:radical SAM superfamily enzyme YgiQ (UPF0313 family)